MLYIKKLVMYGFKSFVRKTEVPFAPGINVIVGANGSGKSNLLEAIGVLSAAADGKVTDQTLLQRGVRPGVPKLYKSAFPSTTRRQLSHIYFSARSAQAHFNVSLNNPMADPSPAWRFKTELLERGKIINKKHAGCESRKSHLFRKQGCGSCKRSNGWNSSWQFRQGFFSG